MNKDKETVLIAWCDTGTVEGAFASELMYSILECQKMGYKFSNVLRVVGNQISRQRNFVIDEWQNKDEFKSDWLLFVDSDIIVTPESLDLLFSTADEHTRKVVSGIYYVHITKESSINNIYPSIFKFADETSHDLNYLNNVILPNINKNSIIQIDAGGMGFTLIHKSIINKVKESAKQKENIFMEYYLDGDYVSEDVSFFRSLKKAGITAYAQTGAFVKHMKTIALTDEMYDRNKNV
jgi:hypothetical protein